MLTPEQKRNIPTALTDKYAELTEFILRDLAKRIADGAKLTDTAEYQLYRAKALGLSEKAIAAKVAEINGIAAETVEQLIYSAADTADRNDREHLGASDAVATEGNEPLYKLMKAQVAYTQSECKNLTNTLGFADHNTDGTVCYRSLTDMYRRQMDAAQLKVMNGVTDYTTALRQAVNKLAASGVRSIDYESGCSRTVEAATRNALMTSISQVTNKISEQNAEEFGADGWEMSAHSGARPSHAVYQGRQYTQKEYEHKIRDLLNDYGCRHDAYPIILGISKPVYTEEELKNIDPPPFTYEGRRYTAYEAQQQMRKMERAMRRQKDRCIVADSAGDKEAFTAASIKLRRQKDIYEDFCRKADSFTQYERTIVGGYDRHLSGKTGAVTRKARAFDRAQIRLDIDTDEAYNYMGGEHLFSNHINDETIDIKAARKEYDIFLNNNVPKNHMKLLKQYSYGATFAETKDETVLMGYSPSNDAYVYNPTNPQLANYDLNMSFTHEIAHRIDNKLFHSDKRKSFLTAILKYQDELDYQSIAEKITNSDDLFQNAPLQDIMSAVTKGQIPLLVGHKPEYWEKTGKRQKEIFANLFTLECFDDTVALEFIKETLPDIYDSYITITAKKLGRDINDIANN